MYTTRSDQHYAYRWLGLARGTGRLAPGTTDSMAEPALVSSAGTYAILAEKST